MLLIKQFCAHKEILYENMDYLWHNRYVALQSGVLMKMYRERQFLGLFTVHYHYRTENRDSSLQLGTKQPKITTLLFDLFNEHAYAYQHMPAYFHYITQNHAYLPTHTRTWVPMMAQWPPLMRGHPFWEATFTQHLGWLLVRGFTVLCILSEITLVPDASLLPWGQA